MSIFPKRTSVSTIVTIHVNIYPHMDCNTVAVADMELYVHTPDGLKDKVHEGCVVICGKSSDNPFFRDPEIDGQNPVLLSYDAVKKRRFDTISASFKSIRDGNHFYFHYHLDEHARLGKYTISLKVRSNGREIESSTKDDDFFFVEQLAIEHELFFPEKCVVKISNKSGENTPCKLLNVYPPTGATRRVEKRVLDKFSSIEYSFPPDEILIVLYSEGRQRLVAPTSSSDSTYFKSHED